jgi:hypothetical protein
MISQYEPVVFPGNSANLEARKQALVIALNNCYITRDIGTEQMRAMQDRDILEDIYQMRAAALTAIPLGESALRASTDDDFAKAEREFRAQYVNLISSVKSFLWDAKGPTRNHLWPLVEELM